MDSQGSCLGGSTKEELQDANEEAATMCTLYNKSGREPIRVLVQVDGVPLSMEVDTGARVSLISESTLKHKFPNVVLSRSTVRVSSYTLHSIPVCGEFSTRVRC